MNKYFFKMPAKPSVKDIFSYIFFSKMNKEDRLHFLKKMINENKINLSDARKIDFELRGFKFKDSIVDSQK